MIYHGLLYFKIMHAFLDARCSAGVCSTSRDAEQIDISRPLCLLKDGLTGSAWGDWANYTASPLRAFENELGVQAPVGFWDPVGFTSDGDVATFKRRRSVELKHGRISMMATMGFSVADHESS